MKIEEFKMERWQSLWENSVDINLSESGVHPMTLKEILGGPLLPDRLLQISLGYPQTNGSVALRKCISDMYEKTTEHHIQVTNGGSEANLLTVLSLVEPGDEIILMLPNYMQIGGLAQAFGGIIKPFFLHEEDGWAIDPAELKRLVSIRTRLIAVCHPNNPTGSILSEGEIRTICEVAASARAWILADEIYRGAERKGTASPSFWGRYERVIVTGGLSKAYGLPGLRIGWIVAPPEFITRTWSCHDYTTIAPGALSDALAQAVLHPDYRPIILERTRGIIRENFPILAEWVYQNQNYFRMIAPRAGAIAFLHCNLPQNPSNFCRRLLQEKSVLIIPGDQLGMDGFVRIGFGATQDRLKEGLRRIQELIGNE